MMNKLDQWKEELTICKESVTWLLQSRDIYNKLVDIVSDNPRINSGNRFFPWLKNNYEQALLMGIRKLIDRKKNVVSLKRLLFEMSKDHRLLNRSNYISLTDYQHLPISARNHSFDYMAGDGAEYYPQGTIDNDIAEIEKIRGIVEELTNKRIAHNIKGTLEKIPTYDELDVILNTFERMVIKYWALLTGQSYLTLLPTVQYEWLDIFRIPWINETD